MDKMQMQRFELKYIIPAESALAMRNFLSGHLELDEFCAKQANLSYTVHSLYLDSDILTIYWQTINGNKNRYKLRIRFYEDNPDAPVFFEIKRRMNDAILKQRGAVHRDAVDYIMAGHLPEPRHIVSKDPKQLVAVQRFSQLMIDNHAKPKAHVAYFREAWMHPTNNSVRVTFDREVKCSPEFTTRFTAQMDHPVLVFGNKVVLELKFTGRFPDWFKELARVFGLAQCSAAKFADGIALLGEKWFEHSRFNPMDPASQEKVMERLDSLKQGERLSGNKATISV